MQQHVKAYVKITILIMVMFSQCSSMGGLSSEEMRLRASSSGSRFLFKIMTMIIMIMVITMMMMMLMIFNRG